MLYDYQNILEIATVYDRCFFVGSFFAPSEIAASCTEQNATPEPPQFYVVIMSTAAALFSMGWANKKSAFPKRTIEHSDKIIQQIVTINFTFFRWCSNDIIFFSPANWSRNVLSISLFSLFFTNINMVLTPRVVSHDAPFFAPLPYHANCDSSFYFSEITLKMWIIDW